MHIKPPRQISGCLTLPGDKSISHRMALIAASADGTSHLSNFASSQDCGSTLDCLRNLGVQIQGSRNKYTIIGAQEFRPPDQPLDCGNSGTTMRILSGVLATQDFTSELIGDTSLSLRPMRRIIEPLELMGAQIAASDGRPPLRIKGTREVKAISYKLPIASAQVKSAILFAALRAKGRTEVIETAGSRDHTERLFGGCGVTVHSQANDSAHTTLWVDGPARLQSRDMVIPGDASSAAYFAAAAMLLKGSSLTLENVGLNPTRIEFLSVLRSWGADVRIENSRVELKEPVGTIHVNSGVHATIPESDRVIAGHRIPSLIDELPLLAVVGSQIAGGIRISDAEELRSKESDRLRATATNLRAMGVAVEENRDGLIIDGPVKLRGARLESFGDHRIAMAFSIAALLASSDSYIADSDCVKISFPEFFELLDQVIRS